MDKDCINTLAKLTVEYWKLLRSYDRAITVLPPDPRFHSVARNAERRLLTILSEADLKLVSYEGQKYSPNLAVSVINSDEFEGVDELVISQMVEPTIIHRDVVIGVGKAVLEKIK